MKLPVLHCLTVLQMMRCCISISLGLFSVKEKEIFSAGAILQMDQIMRMISDSESNKLVAPEMSVKFLLNPSLPCMQVCLRALNKVLSFPTSTVNWILEAFSLLGC